MKGADLVKPELGGMPGGQPPTLHRAWALCMPSVPWVPPPLCAPPLRSVHRLNLANPVWELGAGVGIMSEVWGVDTVLTDLIAASVFNLEHLQHVCMGGHSVCLSPGGCRRRAGVPLFAFVCVGVCVCVLLCASDPPEELRINYPPIHYSLYTVSWSSWCVWLAGLLCSHSACISPLLCHFDDYHPGHACFHVAADVKFVPHWLLTIYVFSLVSFLFCPHLSCWVSTSAICLLQSWRKWGKRCVEQG